MSDFTPNVFSFEKSDFSKKSVGGDSPAPESYSKESSTPSSRKTEQPSQSSRKYKYRVERGTKSNPGKLRNKESSCLDLPNLVVKAGRPKTKTKINSKKKGRRKSSHNPAPKKTEEILLNDPKTLGALSAKSKTQDSDDGGSSFGSDDPFQAPMKYRKNKDSPLSRVNKMKSERLRSASKRSFSSALQKSLADMSEHIIISKKSMSQTTEEEKDLNEDADQKVTQRIVTRTNKKKHKELSLTFRFGGHAYDDYNCFGKTPQYFVQFFSDAFQSLELSLVYNDDRELLASFIDTVRDNYRSENEVPFHNFYHGFSVGQVAVTFILRSYFMKIFYDRKILFTLVIASLMHDVDHPGNDNFYELISNSKRHAKHGKDATLENHHSEKMMELMKENDGSRSIFKYLSAYNQNIVFENACDLIMATDMSKHKDKLNFLKGIEDLKYLRGEDHEDDRHELLLCIIHACDLSGQCFDNNLAIRWEQNIHREMQNQYNRLVKDKLPIPDSMKRFTLKGKSGKVARYRSQATFINYVLVPYWEEIVRLFPQMSDFLKNLKANGQYFERRSKSIRK